MGKNNSEYRPRLTNEEYDLILKRRQSQSDSRVLVIGDLHEPFCLDGYLEHCKVQYDEYECNEVVLIGDVVDNHFASYHETDPDGFSGGDELALAIFKIKKWYETFSKATWILGNHDRLINRKAMTGGLSKKWIKPYNEVLEVPGWTMTEEYVLNDVQYIHGEGGTARSRMRKDLMSTVQGHLHTQAYIEYGVGKNYKIYGFQVGCGIDNKSFSMAYAKNFPKPAIGCGVILEDGKVPILKMMEL